MAPDGTEFQCRVWQVLQDIPMELPSPTGSWRIAWGLPGAFQAVGQANRRNPLPILIPCHRVIASNGTLGGYSGGVERKRVPSAAGRGFRAGQASESPRRKREVDAH